MAKVAKVKFIAYVSVPDDGDYEFDEDEFLADLMGVIDNEQLNHEGLKMFSETDDETHEINVLFLGFVDDVTFDETD
jgi:hypothetical protein